MLTPIEAIKIGDIIHFDGQPAEVREVLHRNWARYVRLIVRKSNGKLDILEGNMGKDLVLVAQSAASTNGRRR